MSEPTPPPVPGDAVGDHQAALTPQAIDALLAEFRSWLEQAASAPGPAPEEETESIDLHTLLGQFIALRHEVNLQTRAVRAQQEQNAETLRQLSQAFDSLRQQQANAAGAEAPKEDDLLRPVLKSLLDVADALGLARREVGRVQELVASQLEPPEAASAPRFFWSRWFSKPVSGPDNGTARQVRQFLESVITGYTMSLQRVERVLSQHGLEAIPTTGHPFDPERMEVVEAVTGSDRPAGEVLQEVRRGYLWRDRVFRYAQVSVAKGE